MEQKFITEDELSQIRNLKTQLNQIIFSLGEVKIRKEALLDSYRIVAGQEQEFYNQLSTKYGNGSVDLETGELSINE
jgi:hypothetical protein